MNPKLYIGIVSKKYTLEIATRESGEGAITITFPATGMGVETLRQFLAGHGNPVRMAVTGVAALSLALTLGNVPFRETFIVSSDMATQAVDMARYAEHAV